MIHYVTLGSNDLPRAMAFYDAALEPLGITRSVTKDTELGYGMKHLSPGMRARFFYIVKPFLQYPATWGNGTLITFSAPTRSAVDAFHKAALAHGGADDGEPGLRPWSDTFYACYVRDPDGNKISALCEV
jgi:catechol 2,3-dioxygenase-like lactoylglutathione lyase family enzyme